MSHTNTERKRFTKWRIDLAIHDALAIARKRSCNRPFQRLLAVVTSRSDMLRPQPLNGNVGWTYSERLLRGFLSLCRHRKNWLRDVEDWNPSGDGRSGRDNADQFSPVFQGSVGSQLRCRIGC